MLNTKIIRRSFAAIKSGRICTNNAASTQSPTQLIDLLKKLTVNYDNVHRGQSQSSLETTRLFEASYDTVAQFINAPSRKNIVLFRNTTEAINAVMYSLLTSFRDGDNLVTTYMEHNSNFVPWYGLTKEILPKFGITVECRIARFDKETGQLDLDDLRNLVDDKTKIVCCSGASNFLGTKNPVSKIREIACSSGYNQPNGDLGSYLLIDAAQSVPNFYVDVREWDVDFLAWSFHKMLSPYGVGALYAKESLLEEMLPFLYGGDMIAEGQVSPEKVEYNILPWKFTAGTPNILGTILSAQSIRLLLDFALNPGKSVYSNSGRMLEPADVRQAMNLVEEHETELISAALDHLGGIPGITVYGPKSPEKRTSLVAFNLEDVSPMQVADKLNVTGVESRAGCHCATLAHYYYGLTPLASCRVSFYIYNDLKDVRSACNSIRKCARC